MKEMTISKQLAYGFAAIIALIVATAVISLFIVTSIGNGLTHISTNTVPSLVLLSDIRDGARAAADDVGKFYYASAADRVTLTDKMAKDAADLDAKTKSYEALLSDSTDAELFNGGVQEIANWRMSRTRLLDMIRQATTPEALNLARGFEEQTLMPSMGRIVDLFEKDFAYNVTLSDASMAASMNFERIGMLAMIVLMILGPLLGILIAFLISRRISSALTVLAHRLGQSAHNNAAGAMQVGNASSELANRASEQAATVEETSAALEEMSSMTRSTAANAARASVLASDTKSVATHGAVTMQDMMTAMAAIENSSAEVAKIVKRIDEIAFQTNILALNAAVEAARAGEAGAGFAVVADEVRSLAQRSAAAAKETADKIDAAIANSRQGTVNCDKVGEALKLILSKVIETDTLVSEIASAADDQSKGIEQINTAIEQMDQVTQANATSSQQCASAAEELRTQTLELNSVVSSLSKLVGIAGRGAEAMPVSVSSANDTQVPAGSRAKSKGTFI
ncbi:MAG: methyl-accepting chemotaxis protein [Pseudomonadota bacterium]